MNIGGIDNGVCGVASLTEKQLSLYTTVCKCEGYIGRVPRCDEDDPITLVGNQFQVKPSDYWASYTNSDGCVIAIPVIEETTVFPTWSGNDGVLIYRIPQLTPNSGYYEFIDGITDISQISNSISPDGHTVLAVVEMGLITETPVSCHCFDCLKAVNATFTGTVDFTGSEVIGLEVINENDCFCASIEQSGSFIEICWDECAGADHYEIWYSSYSWLPYNGGQGYPFAPLDGFDAFGSGDVILQIPPTETCHNFPWDPSNPAQYVTFVVRCVKPDGSFSDSQVLGATFDGTSTNQIVVPCGDFGNGSDGAYNDSGDLGAGGLYQFTNFTLNSDLKINGNGTTIIKVQSNLILGDDGRIEASFTNTSSAEEIVVCGQARDISLPQISGCGGGAGGQTSGQLPCPADGISIVGVTGEIGGNGGCWGSSFSDKGQDGTSSNSVANCSSGNVTTTAGTGGLSGNTSNPDGQDGTDGQLNNNGCTSPLNISTLPGAGGGAGGHGMNRGSVVFIVGGNTVIQSGFIFTGFGGNGGDGGDASPGFNTPAGSTANTTASGGGGGGAGGWGGKGANLFIFGAGSNTGVPAMQSQGGDGGNGGSLGSAPYQYYQNSASACGPQVHFVTGFDGQAGTDGVDGANGSYEFISI